jgi:ArsR family transcriptional regulator, arsenate/arsenite/antimonite-responsive transcriptional repressor
MKMKLAVQSLASLAHEHRLAAFRLLVRAGPDGLAAGEIAANLGLPPSSLSFHLSALESAGLVVSSRAGRFIHYRVEPRAVRRLMEFLTEDCCAGRPELCPELGAGCAPPGSRPVVEPNRGAK